MPRWLSERNVRAVLDAPLAMPALIDAMAEALARFSSGDIDQPVRTAIEIGPTPAAASWAASWFRWFLRTVRAACPRTRP
jgi:hypothetical protein